MGQRVVRAPELLPPVMRALVTSASRLKSVIGMGTGAGAYILTRFAVSSLAFFVVVVVF